MRGIRVGLGGRTRGMGNGGRKTVGSRMVGTLVSFSGRRDRFTRTVVRSSGSFSGYLRTIIGNDNSYLSSVRTCEQTIRFCFTNTSIRFGVAIGLYTSIRGSGGTMDLGMSLRSLF